MKKTTARGLGWTHQRTRAHLIANHNDGSPCWWCGQPMWKDAARNFDHATLEADHSLARAKGGHIADRLLHRKCNRERGDGTRDHQRPSLGDLTSPVRDAPADHDPRVMPWPW